MRTYCKYSGVQISVSNAFVNVRTIAKLIPAAHPVFSLPLHQLHNLENEFHRLAPLDKRLLFVALIQKSPLVSFKCPLVPSDDVIAEYLELAFQHASGLKYFNLSLFPRYNITPDNATTSCIVEWLKEVEQIKRTARGQARIKTDAEIAADKAAEYRANRVAIAQTSAFNPKIQTWALKHIAKLALQSRLEWSVNDSKFMAHALKCKISDATKLSYTKLTRLFEVLRDNLPDNEGEHIKSAIVLRNIRAKLDVLNVFHAEMQERNVEKGVINFAGFEFEVTDIQPANKEEKPIADLMAEFRAQIKNIK